MKKYVVWPQDPEKLDADGSYRQMGANRIGMEFLSSDAERHAWPSEDRIPPLTWWGRAARRYRAIEAKTLDAVEAAIIPYLLGILSVVLYAYWLGGGQ